MKKSRRNNRQNNPIRDAHHEKNDPSSLNGKLSRENLLAAATIVGIAYLALPLLGVGFDSIGWKRAQQQPVPKAFKPEDFVKSSAQSLPKRLMEEWQPGDNIKIKDNGGNGENGLFAKWDIQKGQMIARVDFPDLEAELIEEYRSLRPNVQKALEHAAHEHSTGWSTVTAGKILSLIKFMLEDAKGEDSVWHSFIGSIPQNVTNMAWYWSAEEKQCIVSRPGSDSLQEDLNIYHSVMDQVRQSFEPLAEIYTKERAEWAYLILKTRGFGQYFLPVLHLANHNPLQGVPAFIIPKTGSAAYIATRNMNRGDPIYTDYGQVTPVISAEQYGFVEDEPAFFEVPAIFEDLLTNERTKNERLCTQKPMKFFGNVTTQIVDAKYGNGAHSTFFKAFMPTELAYACIRVLLQTERDTDVANYVAEKIAIDLNKYTAILENPACQFSEGNFPLIRQANEATAKSLAGALQVAHEGRDWKIPYPDIPTYKMNHEP